MSSVSPADGATGVATTTAVSATFSEAMNAATIGASTFELRDAANVLVASNVSYDAPTLTARLTPTAVLAASQTYTATVRGGSTGVKDAAGNALTANRTWSFTTGGGTGGCNAPPNPIVAENCLAGSPASEWDISGSGDPSIQGFATDISVNRGTTVSFKVSTNATAYRFDIYRMGYYGGLGARKVASVNPSAALPQNQPNCLNDASTGLIDCGNWAVSGSWAVPATAASGIYFAKLVRADNGGASHIVFIVRDDASTAPLLFQTSDTTWQAYNNYGGNSLYTGSPAGRAYKVSYNRPFNTRAVDNGQDWLFNAEYPMVRWLESNGYDVAYISGVDSHRAGALLRNHKVFLSVGHDEYWSGGQRANVTAARDAGVHLAFFSGNEVFWKTRWEPSIDGSNTANRTLVCYKETHANAKIDPSPEWTGTWRDPRFSPPSDGGRPENGLAGTIFMANDTGVPFSIEVPAADGKMRFWRNTSVASLAAGQTATLPVGTLGYEWDSELDNGARPPGLWRLSTTPKTNFSGALLDYGSTYGNGTVTHYLTQYRAPSGALVFGAGTIQWSWGLDASHDRGSAATDASGCSRRPSTCSLTWACSRPPCVRASSRPAHRRMPRRRPRRSHRRRPAARWRSARRSRSAAARATAAAWSAVSKSRSTAARAGTRRSGAAAGVTVGRRRRAARSRSGRARSTTAATWKRRARALPSRPAAAGRPRPTPPHRPSARCRRRTTRLASHATSTPA